MRKSLLGVPPKIVPQVRGPTVRQPAALSVSNDELGDKYFQSVYGDQHSFRIPPKSLGPPKTRLSDTMIRHSKTEAAPFHVKLPNKPPITRNVGDDKIKATVPQRVVVPSLRRPIRVSVKPKDASPTEGIPAQSYAANDTLSIFDDNSFDEPGFLEKISRDLQEGKQIRAHSLFYTSQGECEWRPCLVLKYTPPVFTIRWILTGRTKEVLRISLRFDDEDEKRFEERRKCAEENRSALDLSERTAVHMWQMAKNQAHVMDPSLIASALRKLPKNEAESNRINEMVQELQYQYNLAMASLEYEEQWKDETTAAAMKANGLSYITKAPKPVIMSRKIAIPGLVFGDFVPLKSLVREFVEIENQSFLDELMKYFRKPVMLSEYLHQVKFAFETKIAHTTGLACKVYTQYAREIISGKSEDEQTRLVNMINLRYGYALSRLQMVTMKFAVESGVRFCLKYNKDLSAVDQTPEFLVNCMNELLEFVRNAFSMKPPDKIQPLGYEAETLTLSFEYLDDLLGQMKTKWKETVDESFERINEVCKKMLNDTEAIPSDTAKICDAILDPEWKDVINGAESKVSIKDIRSEEIDDVYSRSEASYAAFQLNYEKKIELKIFTADISEFHEYVANNREQLKASIFSYLSRVTDSKLRSIGMNMEFLSTTSGKAPESVEEWHTKHRLLLELHGNVSVLESSLNEVKDVFAFFDKHQFEPEHSYVALYQVKAQLLNLSNSISAYSDQDEKERAQLIEQHKMAITTLTRRLEKFAENLHSYHKEDPTVEVQSKYAEFLEMKETFGNLSNTISLYQERDKMLNVPCTEYECLKPIKEDMDLLFPIWEIAHALDTTVPRWLATFFREMNVSEITDTMVKWEQTLKSSCEVLGDDHPMTSKVQVLLKETTNLIMHLPIVRALCNPNFRGRHWGRISKLTNMSIGPNDGITWNWLIESGIEDSIAGIAAISRAADQEFQIEKILVTMIDDLRNLRLKVVNVDGVMKLDDPTYVVVMLSEHQNKMQEIFLPPFVNPFLNKIKEYDILAANLRQIIKQTLDTQKRIEELQPAMKSTDVKTQHQDVSDMFDDQVSKFNDFTTNFKLSLTFHHIVANERYVDISQELSDQFKVLRQQLDEILEEKRKKFPRFRLLSDDQLVKMLTHSEQPSKNHRLFSLMYPAISEPIFEDDKVCTGFISNENETFHFVSNVTVTPEAIETWLTNFDHEIKNSMKIITKTLLDRKLEGLETICREYPSQICCLVWNVIFTSQVNSVLRSYEQGGSRARPEIVIEKFERLLDSIEQNMNMLMTANLQKQTKGITAMIITMINAKQTLEQLLDHNVTSFEDPVWYSKVKYELVTNGDDYDINVHIGPCILSYGFDFVGGTKPPIQTQEHDRRMASIMMSVKASVVPVVCGCVDVSKLNVVTSFAYIIGKQSLIYPCVGHSTFQRISQTIEIASLCSMFLIFQNIPLLKREIFNDLSVHILELQRQKKLPAACATYSFLSNSQSQAPEHLKLAFYPVIMRQYDLCERYEVILASFGLTSTTEFAKKLTVLTSIVSNAFPPPTSSVLSFRFVKDIIGSITYTGSLVDFEKEVHKRLIQHVSSLLKIDDIAEIRCAINHVFGFTGETNESSEIETNEVCSGLDCKLKELLTAIKHNYGVILIGPALSGKTSLIKMAAKEMNVNIDFVNPTGMDPLDLFGDVRSGILSTIVQKSKLMVFDGALQNNWMEIVSSAISPTRSVNFGDGTMYKLKADQMFILETDSISGASPATISYCASFYIGESFFRVSEKLKHFTETIEQDPLLIEPLSNTIVGSRTPGSALTNVITKFSEYFLPKLQAEFVQGTPVSFSTCLNNYFTLLYDLILHYFVPDEVNTNLKNTSEDLISDTPNLALFALFWSFVGAYSDVERERGDEFIRSLLSDSPFEFNVDGPLIDVFFDGIVHKWRKWDELPESGLLRISASSQASSVLEAMTDVSPEYLMIPNSTLFPALLISNVLLSQSRNVLIYGPDDVDKRIFSNLILHSPYVLHSFSPSCFSWSERYTHKVLKEMVASMLPDPHVSQGWSLRKPLLSLTDFDAATKTRSSELMRFMIEHDFFFNHTTYGKEILNGIRFMVSCNEIDLNPRLAHHMFLLRVLPNHEETMIAAVSQAVTVLWNIQEEAAEIAQVLISLLRDVQTSFKFNIRHLLMLLQRVAIVQQGRSSYCLCEALTHEAVRVFYDAIHEEEILAKINLSTRAISKIVKSEYVNAFDIAGHTILSNINSTFFRPVSSLHDVADSCPVQSFGSPFEESKQGMLKFTKSQFVNFAEEMTYKPMGDLSTEIDVLAMSRTLTTPRTHSIIYTAVPEQCSRLVTQSCDIVKAELHQKRLHDSLMTLYHDSFIQSGLTKTHHVLFIDLNTLTPEEESLVSQMITSSDVFGLFGRGEKLRLMTDLYTTNATEVDVDETVEADDSYNILLSDFITDCETYFHLCIVRDTMPSDTMIAHAHIFTPFYESAHAIRDLLTDKLSLGQYSETIQKIRSLEIFQRYPYLVSHYNINHLASAFGEKYNRKKGELLERKRRVDRLWVIGKNMEEMRSEITAKMGQIEQEVVKVNEELAESFKQTEELGAIAAAQAKQLEEKAAILAKEGAIAEQLRQECTEQMKKTKTALDEATKEVTSLSSRDIAVIKGMNVPPHGVVLVSTAMCLILGQSVPTNADDETLWKSGKKVMTDVSFLTKLTSRALESLSPAVIDKLRKIISDPNFDPNVIQRASTAAKSICKFVRAIVPYYGALDVYKEKMAIAEQNEARLRDLREQNRAAVAEMNVRKQQFEEIQARQNELEASRKAAQDRLADERDRSDQYKRVWEFLKPFFAQIDTEREELEKKLQRLDKECLLSQCLLDLCGPFDKNDRNTIISQISEILNIKIQRHEILPTDDPNVTRWALMRYPVSQFWKETTAMLSPVGKRWVCAVGLARCAHSYLKRVMNRNVICYLSVQSHDFESQFLHAMRKNMGVVLFDYDFRTPNLVVQLTYAAQSKHNPFVYHEITYEVPDDFVVYIDAPVTPTDEMLRLNVRLMDLQISESVTAEMIALRLHELTNEKQANESHEIEKGLKEIDNDIATNRATIESMFIDSNTRMFEDKAKQYDLTNLNTNLSELNKKRGALSRKIIWLFDDFPTLELISKTLNEFFAPFPNSGKLWQIFEAQFELVQRISSETLLDSVRKRLLTVMAAELPLRERIIVTANAFQLKLDGSNCGPVNPLEGRPMYTSYSTTSLPFIAHFVNDEEEEDHVNSLLVPEEEDKPRMEPIPTPQILPRCSSALYFLSESVTANNDGFDRLLNALVHVTENGIFKFQEMKNIIDHTSCSRPIICHTSDSVFQFVSLIETASLREKCEIVNSQHLKEKVLPAAQSGTILITFCSSQSDLTDVLAPISAVFGSGYISPDFRLLILVQNRFLKASIEFSSLFQKCDIVSIDAPITIKTAFASVVNSLGYRRYSEFIARLCLFYSAFSIVNRLHSFVALPSFFTFRIACLCSSDANSNNINDLGTFVSKFLYDEDASSLWHRLSTESFRHEYPLPRLFNKQSIERSISEFPSVDDPRLFGLTETAFALFKERLMQSATVPLEPIPHRLVSIETPQLFRNELFLLRAMKSLKQQTQFPGQRVEQIARGVPEVDISLVIACDLLLDVLRYQAFIRGPSEKLPELVLSTTNERDQTGSSDGILVHNLICRGAALRDDVFVRRDETNKLPVMWLHASFNVDGLTRARFSQDGRTIGNLYVRTESPFALELIPSPL